MTEHRDSPFEVGKRSRRAGRRQTGAHRADPERQQQPPVVVRRHIQQPQHRAIAGRLAREQILAGRQNRKGMEEEQAFSERRHASEPEIAATADAPARDRSPSAARRGAAHRSDRPATGSPAAGARQPSVRQCRPTSVLRRCGSRPHEDTARAPHAESPHRPGPRARRCARSCGRGLNITPSPARAPAIQSACGDGAPREAGCVGRPRVADSIRLPGPTEVGALPLPG